MPLERETSARPVAEADEDEIERRLRALGSRCAVLAAAVLATAGAVGWAAVQARDADWMTSAPGASFLMAVCGMVLVLLASAAHGRILRRQADAEMEAMDGVDGAVAAGTPLPVPAAARLRGFSWATGVCFGMLAAAAVLGALAAASGKAAFYGLIVCVAVLFAMKARWPTRRAFELAYRAADTDAGRAATAAGEGRADRADRAGRAGGGGDGGDGGEESGGDSR